MKKSNKTLLILTLTAVMMSTVACSSSKKQEDQQLDIPAVEASSLEETDNSLTSEVTPTEDLSLGAGSSGRGR